MKRISPSSPSNATKPGSIRSMASPSQRSMASMRHRPLNADAKLEAFFRAITRSQQYFGSRTRLTETPTARSEYSISFRTHPGPAGTLTPSFGPPAPSGVDPEVDGSGGF